MLITLKDDAYDINQVEMIINFKNKEFDGEIHKCHVDIKFKFGIQCVVGDLELERKFNQEINQTILWTEYDIENLYNGVNEIHSCSLGEKKDYYGIGLVEPEFEMRCFVSDNEYEDGLVQKKEIFVLSYISVGIHSAGPTIKLWTTRAELLRWVNEIKDKFYNMI